MMSGHYYFKDVTLFITHYNRSRSLERLLASLAGLSCNFGDTVVSDDASRPEELARVNELQLQYGFRLVTAPQNRGYGNCINKGMAAINTPYTVYIQEDFVPFESFPRVFADAVELMDTDLNIDYIRFWAIEDHKFDLMPYGKGFSQMVYRIGNMRHTKFYQFSDTPNIRRSTFTQKFGRYREGIFGDLTDYYMAISFLHNKGKGLFYDQWDSVFAHDDHEGSRIRSGTVNWRQRQNLLIRLMRFAFLRYKWLKGTWLVMTYKGEKQHEH